MRGAPGATWGDAASEGVQLLASRRGGPLAYEATFLKRGFFRKVW
jgi:hypothetical protein